MTSTRTRSNLGTTLAIVAAVLAVIGAIIAFQLSGEEAPEVQPADASQAVERDDSHVLDDPEGASATLVEFLDFECEACGAAYPLVEDLRERFEGDLKFVIRYFPLDGHFNSRNAAHAVESAARQGKVEEMYTKMFQTQSQWGDQRQDYSELFRGFAEEIGLDMEQYDRDVVSDSVAQRVERDYQDGLAAGVTGTPSFFLDGEKLEITSTEGFVSDLQDAIDDQ